ncbi:chloride channel protein [Psychrosphaera sp. 1_MG-2023]|uniref:chloride channel protein n=1 Tax=Psychrosphaera sp. 1_MG-2023 TaxID=3062643 RepID=UPI0026E2E20E|nr:chloride channel protein [Psychrosphaera sp. 1_MG-2023]MDO6718246.1 chloride channel protein [Psychrosphaera sp. 1_MG-2023]
MLSNSLFALRRRLAYPRTSIQLSILGLIGGCSAAVLIVLFRLTIEWIQSFFNPGGPFDDILEYIVPTLPIFAALLIAIFADFTGYKHYRLGIPFVLHRIKAHYGNIPFWNFANQFVGGVLALSSGFTVGREGPAVHIGATGASWFGQWLRLPHNSVRTLSACGIAAGISASFNTPLAAVIFVMEVVLREYKIHIFIPVMLASAAGSLITQAVFGTQAEFEFLSVFILPSYHYPWLIILGLTLGAVAFVFNRNLMRVIKAFRYVSMFPRLLLAGTITAIFGYFIPESFGDGTSAIYQAMVDPTNLNLIVILLVSKVILTWVAIGLGIPGGIIGPIFGIGVLIGLLIANVVITLDPTTQYMSTYAVLGMAGLMAATLHAPLAALVSVMELTANPGAITPAIIVIVMAYVTSAQFLKNRSIFLQQLDFQGLMYQTPPATNELEKIGVLAELNRNLKIIDYVNEQDVRFHIRELEPEQSLVVAIRHDLGVDYSLAEFDSSFSKKQDKVKYIPMQTIDTRSTLAHVYELLQDQRDGATLVTSISGEKVVGIVTWEQLHLILMKRNALI